MATAHQVSVIVNSCYKPPVVPQTGLPATANDSSTLGDSWFGKDADYLDDNYNISKANLSQSVNFDTTNTMLDTMNVDLSELTDEEFYKRLSDLKTEHKKTLELCERLYNEKLREFRTGAAPTESQQQNVPIATVDAEYVLAATGTHSEKDVSRSLDLSKPTDRVRDMSASKPPIARPSKSHGTPSKSGSSKKHAWSRSTQDFWKYPSVHSSDADQSGDETETSKLDRSLEALNLSRASYLSRIEDMWENFSVDRYAPRDKHKPRPRSSSLSHLSTSRSQKKDDPMTKSQEWKHRITIPEPFKMTLREANKTPKKTKAMLELEQKREEERRREEAECQRKFKARPVPAHVYMPLFQEIMEEKESKRRYLQKATAEMLLSMQKPFKFDIRESEEKKFRRSHSTPCDLDINEKPKKTFKARPFPAHIFDTEIDEKLKEEEEYRKIRIQMRSEELLRSASLPPNMTAKGREYTEGKFRHKIYAERAKKAGLTKEHKFKPAINDTIPDFERKHKKFLIETMKKKDQKEATVCKPFRLHSAKLHKEYHQRSHSRFGDEDGITHKRSRSQPLSKASSYLSTSVDSIPAKMTTAAHLRSSATKNKMQSAIERELEELEREHRRRQREKELRKYVIERALYNDNTCVLQNETKEKLKQFKESDRARMMEYRRQLNEINDRVKRRPLLFEQTMQDNAKHRAEKKYKETLTRAGIDEDFISSKGRGIDNDDVDLDSYLSDSLCYNTDPVSHSHSVSGSRRYSDGGSASDRTADNEEEIEEEILDED